uniref:Uncharacterized protein n=1 Tax=Peronospora matthiolae TaxID=2874970 RepID=A0AAV1VEA2_9STRA
MPEAAPVIFRGLAQYMVEWELRSKVCSCLLLLSLAITSLPTALAAGRLYPLLPTPLHSDPKGRTRNVTTKGASAPAAPSIFNSPFNSGSRKGESR